MVSTGNGENLPFGVGVGDVGVGLVGLILDLSVDANVLMEKPFPDDS